MKTTIITLWLALSLATAHAQEGGTIRGTVHEAQTGKPVPGASVYNQDTDEVAITDDNGRFELTTPAGKKKVHLAIVDPSYKRADAVSDGSTDIDIQLTPVSLRGEEVVVETALEHAAAGETAIRREEIMKIPGSNGDPLKAIKNLPGIANTSGIGQQGLVIRGSSPADSKIFVDGFEVPLLYHLGGITSVLPGEMIDELSYSPGGFGVEWGQASGGIVQVRSRQGGNELTALADVSFIHAQGLAQGPIGKNGNFAVAVRRSYIDALIPLVVPSSSALSFTALPRYYDYQARADYRLSTHLALSAFLIGSDDSFGVSSADDNSGDPASTRFSNTTSFQRVIAAATYDRPGVYAKLAVSGLDQHVGLEVGSDRYLHARNQVLTVRDDTKLALGKRVAIVAGGEAKRTDFDVDVKLPRPPHEGDPSQPNFTYDPIVETEVKGVATDLAAWTAFELQPISRWKTTAGIRVDDFTRNHATVVQPRVQTRVKLDGGASLLGAFGLYTRPPQNQDENIQTELRPERAWQSSVGIENTLAPGVTLQSTAYYIDRDDLIVQRMSRADEMPADGSGTYENAGIGRSYGAEIMLQARGERFFGWAAYTFARSERRDHPTSDWRKFDEDQTHNLVVLGSYKLGAHKQWQIGGRFQYTTGKPFTPVAGTTFESDRNSYIPVYGLTNSQRDAAPHQLDVRIDYYWQFQDWKLSAYLDVSNVYLNAPVVAVQYNDNYTKRNDVTGLPILPALGVRGEF